jgi:hypothetical protein
MAWQRRPWPQSIVQQVFRTFLGGDDFPKSGTKIMEEHIATVPKLTPAERFLEFDVKEGWAPLCQFLGKEVPETDFPRLNDVQNYKLGRHSCIISNRPYLTCTSTASIL